MANFYKPQRKLIESKTLIVTVKKLDVFGQGIAYDRGKVVFVANALPGETVTIKIVEDKKQYQRAVVLRTHHISPERQIPICPHYSRCGGCQLQHVSPELQQHTKVAALTNLLEKLLKNKPCVTIDTICCQTYHYRRRARLALNVQHGKLIMGYRQSASSTITPISHCPVLVESLNALLLPLYHCLCQLSDVKQLGHVELVQADNGSTVLLRCLIHLSKQDCDHLIQFAQIHHVNLFLLLNNEKKSLVLKGALFYCVDHVTLHFNPWNFIQINAQVNQYMVEQALIWLELQSSDQVLDLFCGVGNFTLPIAKYVKKVVGIEGVAELVSIAHDNAKQQQLNNVEFFQEDLQTDLSRQLWTKLYFNKIVLDPSRTGAFEVMPKLINISPSHLIYISCHPATLSRDGQLLIDAGYTIAAVCMMEMFPQTKHLEAMVLFRK